MSHLHSLFPAATILQWAEFDGDSEHYAVLYHGELIVADSLPLLLAALREREPLRLAA